MKLHAILTSALLACASTTALAQECKPLQLIDTVKMSAIEGENRRTIPVNADGTEMAMLIDTAGFVTVITPEAATRAELHIQGDSDRLRLAALIQQG